MIEVRRGLHRALGVMQAPERVTQEAFEGNERHLRRLARLRPGDKADAEDLRKYIQDVRYTEVDGSLFRPFCLHAWRDDVRGVESDCGGEVIENFYPVLANQSLFQAHFEW